MFKYLKSLFKLFIASYRVSKQGGLDIYLNKKLTNGEYTEKLMINSHPVFIIEDDDAVISTGFRYGMVTIIGLTSFTKKIVIVVEKLSIELGIDKYVVYHEMGHIYNEILAHNEINKRNLQDEINADMYAMNILGKEETIRSMKILAEQIMIDSEEIYERIKALEEI